MKLADTFLEHFSDIQDPRIQNHNFRHHLSDILMMAILATLCGADGWVEIERFALAKQAWLSSFLELPPWNPFTRYFWAYFFALKSSII